MKFSIIVPVYNVKDYLRQCVDSVLAQKYRNYELILIDDGSNDGSQDICDEYALIDSRIKVMHKNNGGLSSARNHGLGLVTGEYIVFLDADDYIDEGYLEEIHGTCEATKAEIIAIKLVFNSNNISKIRALKKVSSEETITGDEFLYRTIKGQEFNAEAYANIYRTSFWKENEFLFKEGIYHEDMEIALKIFLRARKVTYCDKCIYFARVRQKSIMTDPLKANKRYSDMIGIISEWMSLSERVTDRKIARIIKGLANKCFVYSAAYNNISKPSFNVVPRMFILKYSLNALELLKGIMFCAVPGLYNFLWLNLHNARDNLSFQIIRQRG